MVKLSLFDCKWQAPQAKLWEKQRQDHWMTTRVPERDWIFGYMQICTGPNIIHQDISPGLSEYNFKNKRNWKGRKKWFKFTYHKVCWNNKSAKVCSRYDMEIILKIHINFGFLFDLAKSVWVLILGRAR